MTALSGLATLASLATTPEPSTAAETATLTPAQAAAFETLRRFILGKTDASMAVLRGYAGTGKTYLVAELIASLAHEGLTLAVAAPTNKAVRVLREKLASAGVSMPAEPTDELAARRGVRQASLVEFGSIHSLLGLTVSEREDGSQECKSSREPCLHEFDAVIVDECSMISDDLFARIIGAKRSTRVLFVGDPAQLPPIQPADQISPTFSKVTLECSLSEVVRQAEGNPIIRLSMMIRQAIERGQRIDAAAVASVLPSISDGPKAALVQGDGNTVVNFALYEAQAGRDARVLAFTNAAVLRYNQAIHTALHGATERAFVVGEPVIVHSQCDALNCDEDGALTGTKSTLITSEEATVRSVLDKCHPFYADVPAYQLILQTDSGALVAVFVPENLADMEQKVSECFAEWRRYKGLADEAFASGRGALGAEYREQAKTHSSKAWAMRRAFAPLRHAYALTAHKSQGSTFHTAIVDFGDMNRMRSDFQFNRGLYVAITRPREHLAIVV